MAPHKNFSVKKILVLSFWILLIALCFVNRDKITVEAIVNFTPESTIVAVITMLVLFALKGVTVVIYGGILYTACGIMFSLPIAIFVNTLGTIIMISVPFAIGKKAGNKIIDIIIQKNSRLEIIRDIPDKNELFLSFFLRIVGLIPADLLGMYFGASGTSFKKYLLGSVVGLFPSIVAFSVMGMSVNDVSSPAFIISVVVEIGLIILSLTSYLIWRKKKNKTSEDSNVNTKNQYISNA